MNYQFPTIAHINDVLPFISGCDDIIVADKGAYKVINYVSMSSDLFRPLTGNKDDITSIIRRECRGLIFDGITDELISRPFHKFFNLGEREETLPENVDLSHGHIILNKLDGSMIRPFMTSDGVLRIGTKMGETEIAQSAAEFFEKDNYKEFAHAMVYADFTAIFEYTSPDNRIVIDYGFVPQLTLTAIRDNHTGKYQDYHKLQVLGLEFKIPIVGYREMGLTDVNTLSDAVRGMNDIEGFVVRFRDGHMVKVKTDQYVAIHKAKDNLLYERLVVEMILNEKVDDILPYLVETDKQRLLAYQDEFIRQFAKLNVNFYSRAWHFVVEFGNSRKDFAINHSKEFGPLASIVFRHFEDMQNNYNLAQWSLIAAEEVHNFFIKKTSSNSTWEQFKNDVGLEITW